MEVLTSSGQKFRHFSKRCRIAQMGINNQKNLPHQSANLRLSHTPFASSMKRAKNDDISDPLVAICSYYVRACNFEKPVTVQESFKTGGDKESRLI
jgi:hypothetical protein